MNPAEIKEFIQHARCELMDKIRQAYKINNILVGAGNAGDQTSIRWLENGRNQTPDGQISYGNHIIV